MTSIIILALLLPAGQGSAVGQAFRTPKWEAGPFFATTTFGQAVSAGNFRVGYGGRITVNVHPNIGFEFQMTRFPGRWENWPNEAALQGSGQVKLTYRAEQHRRVNVFAVVGPGFLREKGSYVSRGEEQVYHYDNVAIAYGGGFEIVPRRRFTVRCDIADFVARSGSYHHFDLKTALMFRF